MKIIWLCIPAISTQFLNWTWISGSSDVDQPGAFSIKGSASPNVYPGSRYGQTAVIHPVTNEFIIFGGYKWSDNYYNDLWSYNYTSNMWTWLSGSNQPNQRGVYGTKGVSSPSNHPGSRLDHEMKVHPASGLLVLFGGYGYDSLSTIGYLNDLWTFHYLSKQWTWINGYSRANTASSYGIKGVPSNANIPGARSGHSMNLHPNTTMAIVFGGFGYDLTNDGYLNDLWSYNFNTNMWTWLSGSNIVNRAAVYGTKGVSSNSNVPSGLYAPSAFIEPQTGQYYIFGGSPGANGLSLDDLWSYDFVTNRWTWISGSSSTNQPGVYGTKGVPSPNNIPRARFAHKSFFFKDKKELIFFGGFAISAYLNDLWLYNLTSGHWTWIGGSDTVNQPGVYGMKAIPSAQNIPGARSSFAFDCSNTLQKCFLFGGYGYILSEDHLSGRTLKYGYLNDLWVYDFNSYSKPSNTIIITRIDQSTSILNSSASFLSGHTIETVVASETLPPNVPSDSEFGFIEIDVSTESPFLTHTSRHPSNKSKMKTTSQQSESVQNFFILNRIYFTYGLVGFASLLVCFVMIKCFYCRLTNPRAQKTTENSETSYSSAQHGSSTASNTSMMTSVASGEGISIPGFRQFEFGLDFFINKEIAKGGMGSVSLGDAFNQKLKVFGDKIIVKQILKAQLTDMDVNMFYQEVSIMYFLREHRNIAKLVGYSDGPYCLLMKFYPLGSVEQLIHSRQIITKSIVMKFLKDICKGVEEMHSKDLAHCDLKPQNVLLDRDQLGLFCVLTDFGITQIVSDKNLLVKSFNAVNIRGASISYAPPEALLRVRKKQFIAGKDLFLFDIYAVGSMEVFEIDYSTVTLNDSVNGQIISEHGFQVGIVET